MEALLEASLRLAAPLLLAALGELLGEGQLGVRLVDGQGRLAAREGDSLGGAEHQLDAPVAVPGHVPQRHAPVQPTARRDEVGRQAELEEGLARNTLAAYRRDLTLFGRWLARRGKPLAATAGAMMTEPASTDAAIAFFANLIFVISLCLLGVWREARGPRVRGSGAR